MTAIDDEAAPIPAMSAAALSVEPARVSGPTPSSMLRAVTSSLEPNKSWAPGVSAETLRRVERAGGSLATRSVALMDERLPWFRSLPAQQRSWVTLVAQAGISGYVVWARSPGHRVPDHRRGLRHRAPRSGSRRLAAPHGRTGPDRHHRRRGGSAGAGRRRAGDRSRCAIRCCATAARWPSPRRRSTRPRPKPAAPGMPGSRPRVVDGIVRGEDFGSLSSRAAALDWDPDRRHPGRRRGGARRRPGRRRRRRRRVGGLGRPGGDVRGARRPTGAGPGRQRTTRPGGREPVRRRPGGPWPAGRGPAGGRRLGRRRAGRTGRRGRLAGCAAHRSTPTTCWPSGCSAVTHGPPTRLRRGDLRAAGRRTVARCWPPWRPTWPPAAHWSRRPATCSCIPTPFATGCTGSPT